jgi:folate-binding protein YgfZ
LSKVLVDSGPDQGAVWHFGEPVKEARALAEGKAWADLSHLEIVSVSGVDRLKWLHDLTTQHLLDIASGQWTSALILDHLGHIEHQFLLTDDGETSWLVMDKDQSASLIAYLNKMKFTLRVEVKNASAEKALIKIPGKTDPIGGPYKLINRGEVPTFSEMEVGIWALEAERVAMKRPRIGLETDHKAIPNELGLLNVSVHLNKGCYRGQETVAKINNLGNPPRKLILLHLDGTEIDLPLPGMDVELNGVKVGFVGTSARHHELGNIALALVKRNVADDAPLTIAGIPALTALG